MTRWVERASCLFRASWWNGHFARYNLPDSNLTLAVRYGADYPKAGGRGEQ
ncbi:MULTISPECIES: hypothetical protein [Moorena]|uniref:hypothetical protein n=1 Tax=Moorena TaxID=1155738 RepID=UPI0013012B3E|nr:MULTISPECIES: hypothetical protein [Moorena]NEQ63849.1 hypothetical protein [Moorena sp. SIO4A1]